MSDINNSWSIPQEISLKTTGSSGEPKEILLTKEKLLASANAAHQFLGAKSGELWSLLLPTNHIAGINVLTRATLLNTKVVGVKDKADYTAIVPTQLYKALNGDDLLLNHLIDCKAVLVGGAPLSDSLRNLALSHGIKVVTTYGSTETCGGCIYNNVPLAGVEVAIESGQLKIKGPMLYTEEWFLTSDFAEIVNGRVFILGRSDDVIISGGENISLGNIELVLNESGQNFVAFSIPDEEWGERLCLASDNEINRPEVRKALLENFGKFAIPKEFIILSEIPLKGIGKPDRVKVRSDYLNSKD